jgi:nucleotide-binding universal stress UspA family protein
LFSKILVAVDGSPYADKALSHAISLAKTYGASLTAMYVVHRRVYVAAEEAGFTAIATLIHDMEDAGKRVLEEAKRKAQSEGTSLDTVLVHGLPAEEIVKKAEAGKYDLIVVGSRGRTAAKAFLLGSISDKISHHAKCPVLIVK